MNTVRLAISCLLLPCILTGFAAAQQPLDPCEPNIVPATIEIHPQTLNLASKGNYVTCYIWIPSDYNVADVNADSILLENQIPTLWKWFEDANDGYEQILMVKFSRWALQDILEPNEAVELTVTGEFSDGTLFEGLDTIRVIGTKPVYAVKRLRVRENKKHQNQHRIDITGTIDTTPDDIADANSITICLWSANDANAPMFCEKLGFDPNKPKKTKANPDQGQYTYKNGLYRYRFRVKKDDPGAVTSCRLNLRKHTFRLRARNIDLSDLQYPVTVQIKVGHFMDATNWP